MAEAQQDRADEGACGESKVYRAPWAACCGVQMNCAVIMNVQYGESTHARRCCRSAWTRKPVVSIQASC